MLLDKRTEKLLSVLNEGFGEDDGFKVFDADDLIAKLPAKAGVSADGLSEMVDFLIEREYIKCKYKDKTDYCLKPLPKGRLYAEERETERKEKFSYNKILMFAFGGSLAGGALGVILFQLIAALIR